MSPCTERAVYYGGNYKFYDNTGNRANSRGQEKNTNIKNYGKGPEISLCKTCFL